MNFNKTKGRKLGNCATIWDLGKYNIGEISLYFGCYDLPLSRLDSGWKNAITFDRAMEKLKLQGYRVASAEEIAQARVEGGIEAGVSRWGGITKEAVIVLPKEDRIVLTKESPLITNLTSFTKRINAGEENPWKNGCGHLYEAFANDSQMYLPTAMEVYPESLPKIKCGTRDQHFLPTDRFDKYEIAQFLFGETAGEYGKFLARNGIENLKVYDEAKFLAVKKRTRPESVNQIEMSYVLDKSSVGFGGNFYHDPVVFLVKPNGGNEK